MFFSISKTKSDSRFHNHYWINGFNVSTDDGWSRTETINGTTLFYKGYSDTNMIENIAEDFEYNTKPRYTGNFCVILVYDNKVVITHDIDRSFPLKYYSNDKISNLPYPNNVKIEDHIWSDSIVEYTNNGINKIFFENFYNVDVSETISLSDCKKDIEEILSKKVNNLNKISNTINIFLSGGIDTTMVYSLLKKYYTQNINIITKEIFEFTEFTTKNMDSLLNHSGTWGYKQFHHWKQNSFYATGGMGDEIFLRGPTTAALWCAWHDVNLLKELENINYAYHKKYFLLEKNKKIIDYYWSNRRNIQEEFSNYSDLCWQICNMVSNDHQHWHLENTISWTPLKDIRIIKNILKLPKDIILKQIIHGIVDLEIISKLHPEMKKHICTHKNHNQYDNLLLYPPFLEKLNNV